MIASSSIDSTSTSLPSAPSSDRRRNGLGFEGRFSVEGSCEGSIALCTARSRAKRIWSEPRIFQLQQSWD